MSTSSTSFGPATGLGQPKQSQQNWLLLLSLIYLMLLAVSIIGSGFKVATGDHAKDLFTFASNPVLGLIIGMVSTALLQSSSTVTSIIVAMVAGGLPISIATPMIMGANIGTSITNTLVSLGHVAKKNEFRRAFQAATVHDFFNVIAVLIFLPLEMMTGFLEKSSAYFVSLLHMEQGLSIEGFNPIKLVTAPVVHFADTIFSDLPSVYSGLAEILLGVGLILLAITYMGRVMRSLMVGKAKELLHSSIGKGPLSGIASGTVMTVLVQSSSTTTSLMVPLVGSGILKTRDIYPFTLGANIGTCITALVAAFAISGNAGGVALQIALVHLLFNVSAVAVVYGLPPLRRLPLMLSFALAKQASKKKLYGLAYITGLFFAMPLSVIYFAG